MSLSTDCHGVLQSAPAIIGQALHEVREGRMVVVCDGPDRGCEARLVMAAECATPAAVNFMAKEARGLICLGLAADRCDALHLAPMTRHGEDPAETAFTVSIEAREGVTTGVSAHDRARTIQVAIDPASRPSDLVMPGHVFPMRAEPGGVLVRRRHTDAAVDLARLSGLQPGAVICEILTEDGAVADASYLAKFCLRHGLTTVTIADLVSYRKHTEKLVERVAEAVLPTRFGQFRAVGYLARPSGEHHVALVKGEIADHQEVLVRMHSQCLTGDVFHSLRCDCGQQLEIGIARIAAEGSGVLVYLSQEGRGIGLLDKLRAYKLQEGGLDTGEANLALGPLVDRQDYGIGAQILLDLGLSSIRMLTNNREKVRIIASYGLSVTAQLPIGGSPSPHNERYVLTKRERMGYGTQATVLPLCGLPDPELTAVMRGAA